MAPPTVLHFCVSTQSGRAKACARRTARILTEQFAVEINSIRHFDEDPFWQMNPADNVTLVLFVSTTGDGEHTVRRLDRKLRNSH